jgi:DHA2 family methylenomycin A resistance protein-like MFS transporter
VTASKQRWTLAACCCAQFLILLDVTTLNVALPAIQRELDVPTGSLVWIINAYVLPLASLILVSGTLGDRYGRKRVFLAGFALFTAFSVGCALATSDDTLIVFRALQGAGAALLAPLSLSILVDAFPPERRAWAIGIWATVAGLGFGGGPILGGALIRAFDWSAIFWMNVPVGITGMLLTLVFVRESRDPNARRLDLVGAALVSAGLFCLTFALVESDEHGWTSGFTLGLLGAAAGLLAFFLLHEAHHPEPMLPLGFFRRRVFARANVLYAVLYAGLAGTLFFVSLYFQNVKGYSPLRTGISWLVMNVPFLAVSVVAGRIQPRFGVRLVVFVGTLLGGIGILGFAALGVDSSFLRALPAYLVVGLGYGLCVPALSTVAMGAIEVEHAGVASGVLNTSRQVGASVGLAALTSIGTAVAPGPWSDPAAYVDGMRWALIVAGTLILATVVLAFAGSRRPAREAAM